MPFRFIFSGLLILISNWAIGQSFVCDGKMYVALLNQAQHFSGLRAIEPGEPPSPALITTITANLGIPVQVLGFSVADNHIYGFNPANYHLYRINSAGQAADLGVPSNLDTANFTYLAGEIGPNGDPFTLIGRSKTTGYDARIYSIRLNLPNIPANWVSVVSIDPIRIEDMAFDPIFGELVGYDSANKRLVSINTSGVVTNAGYGGGVAIESLGSVFFDRKGRLYGYGGSTNLHNRFLQFDRINGQITNSQTAPDGRNSDGCACPYQIRFTKRIEPGVILPCSEVTITYHFHNTAAIAYGQIRITDTLPDIFTITSIERPPFSGTVQSGAGTHIFDATGMQVLLGMDSVVIRARAADAPSGLYGSQASAGNFPLGLGRILLSDDPNTVETDDATFVEIRSDAELFFENSVRICPGIETTLRPTVQAGPWRWSTGATTESIRVSAPGLYWAETESDCGVYRDTILVVEASSDLWADAGPDREIQLGAQLQLQVRHNAAGSLQYQWSASTGDTLSCNTCPNPVVSPLQNVVYSVTITDEYGCTAEDQVAVIVIPDVPIYLPTAFSPDDNGINDIFYAQGPPGIAVEQFQVFDRWGGMVFEISSGVVNDPAHGWNGRRKGRAMPQGLYVWVLRLRPADGRLLLKTGEVFLIR
jgi:gliding motility-associated-like protein